MCLHTTSFLKTKTTHTIQNMFSALKTSKFSTLLTIWELPSVFLLDFFLSSLNSYIFFFSWKVELFGCHLFVCFMRKFLLRPDSRWASSKIFIGTESLVLVIWKEHFSLSKITWGNRVNYLHLCKSIKSITPMGFFSTHSHRLDVCVCKFMF